MWITHREGRIIIGMLSDLMKDILTPTDRPGVYLNLSGIEVDETGTALDWLEMCDKDAQQRRNILSRKDRLTPVEFLEALFNDPSVPLDMRLDSAAKAAPYRERKMPVAIDGGQDDAGNAVPLFANPAALSTEELQQLKDLLLKAGAGAATA